MTITGPIRSMGLLLVGALVGAGVYALMPAPLTTRTAFVSPQETGQHGVTVEQRTGRIGGANVVATIVRAHSLGVLDPGMSGRLPSPVTVRSSVPVASIGLLTPTPIALKDVVFPRFSTPSSSPSLLPTLTPSHQPSLSSESTVVARLATPTPTQTPAQPATETPYPAAIATSVPSASAEPIHTTVGSVVINEIAWAGTDASSTDEWIELFNSDVKAQDLTGWVIAAQDGKPTLALAGSIGAHAYYLIERTNDETISDISADLVIPFSGGSLENAGEGLILKDSNGAVIDSAPCQSGWFAGSAAGFVTMERISVSGSGSDIGNWGSNTGLVTTGLDASGKALSGTPKYKNSVSP